MKQPDQINWGSKLGWVSHFRKDIYKPIFREATSTLRSQRMKSNEKRLKRMGSSTSTREKTPWGKNYNFL